MKPEFGFALSGGGVRGFAHLGVIKALSERGIEPGMISGVSAGAIVGVLLADGYSADEVLRMLSELDLFKMLKIKARPLGLLKPDGFQQKLNEMLRAKSFNELKIPFFVTATNLHKAQAEVFSTGNLIDPVIASMSFPLVIRPHKLNGELYVDGGLMDNLPVHPLEEKVERIIGVYVNPVKDIPEKFKTRNYADRLVHIALRANIMSSIEKCYWFIEPPGLLDNHLFKLTNARSIFTVGYDYANYFLDSQLIQD
ncbi:patatin-like phospholipase family protein [Bacteroidota bacterium]